MGKIVGRDFNFRWLSGVPDDLRGLSFLLLLSPVAFFAIYLAFIDLDLIVHLNPVCS